jgi:hypothetical protein
MLNRLSNKVAKKGYHTKYSELTGEQYNLLFNAKYINFVEYKFGNNINIGIDLITSNKIDINFKSFDNINVNNKRIKYFVTIPRSAKIIIEDKNEMEMILIKHLKNMNFSYVKINNMESIEKIYNLFLNDKIFENGNGEELNYLGIYYKIKKIYGNTEMYYHKSVEIGNDNAMNNLGCYYDENGLSDPEKYFLMAIEKGNIIAMYNLGYYYLKKKKYDLAEKYLLMASENGYDSAMIDLGNYYVNKKNLELAEKYYLMAFYNSSYRPVSILMNFYENVKKSDHASDWNYQTIYDYHNQIKDNGNINLTQYCNITRENFEFASKYNLVNFKDSDDQSVVLSDQIKIIRLLE